MSGPDQKGVKPGAGWQAEILSTEENPWTWQSTTQPDLNRVDPGSPYQGEDTGGVVGHAERQRRISPPAHTGLLRVRLFGRRSGLLAWYYAQPLLSALQSVTILLRALPGQGRPAYLF